MNRTAALFTMLVLTLSTGCIDLNYIEQSDRAEMSPDVKVVRGDGRERDFLVSIARDFPRLQTAMGNPSAYHRIYFSSWRVNVEVFVGAAKDEIGQWGMNSDGSISHHARTAPIDHYDCVDRRPFALDEAAISRLPHLIEDAPGHADYLRDPKITGVDILRNPGRFWRCGDVEIHVNFDSDCGPDHTDRHGAKFYDCPRGDIVYDTNGKLLRSTIDHNVFQDYQ